MPRAICWVRPSQYYPAIRMENSSRSYIYQNINNNKPKTIKLTLSLNNEPKTT